MHHRKKKKKKKFHDKVGLRTSSTSHPTVDHIHFLSTLPVSVSLRASMMQRLQLPDSTKRMMCHFHKLHSPIPNGPHVYVTIPSNPHRGSTNTLSSCHALGLYTSFTAR